MQGVCTTCRILEGVFALSESTLLRGKPVGDVVKQEFQRAGMVIGQERAHVVPWSPFCFCDLTVPLRHDTLVKEIL